MAFWKTSRVFYPEKLIESQNARCDNIQSFSNTTSLISECYVKYYFFSWVFVLEVQTYFCSADWRQPKSSEALLALVEPWLVICKMREKNFQSVPEIVKNPLLVVTWHLWWSELRQEFLESRKVNLKSVGHWCTQSTRSRVSRSQQLVNVL